MISDKLAARFIDAFEDVAYICHEIACSKGWWDESRSDGELIALMHSELSEALEAARHGDPPDDKIPEFSGVEAELADTIIRIMDVSVRHNLSVSGAIIAKARFNATRSHKHGGKKF